MTINLLYPEPIHPDEGYERAVFGEDVVVHRLPVAALDDLPADVRGDVDGLMLFRHFAPAPTLALFPKLRAIVRLGVGYDRIDRAEAARRGVIVCNVPDYGTAEVADHAVALGLGLSRGLFLHHDLQRATPPGAWAPLESPLLRRMSATTYAFVGLGRIGTAAALRAKAFGCDVVFYDPYLPSGADIALDIRRAASLDALLAEADILSLHTPLTPETRGMIGAREIALLPPDAIIVNTARGPILDIDAVCAALRADRLAGVGLDVIPHEPPVDPLPELVRAYRDREPWTIGRVVVTPHVAFCSPDASTDLYRKAIETMHAALRTPSPVNVIAPTDD